jgi:hypothetical protein
VAPFDPDGDIAEDRAYQLVMTGPVALFWHPDVLTGTTDWLTAHGYQLVRLAAGTWTTQADFHRDVAAALDFPDYYGHNLDAFNDCLGDVARYAYGASRDATGTVLVFTGYDVFAGHEPEAAQIILDIIADRARLAMLIGHRFLCLAQSDDPGIAFDPVGATSVSWNPAEETARR